MGFFPTPYPDELLYSACARYGKRTKYSNKKSVMRELFGPNRSNAVFDFPNRLEYFLSKLPPNNYISDSLIDENTLFPFHEAFLTRKRANLIREEMKFAENNKIQMRLALNISQIKVPKYLRFCPLCAENDRNNYGETYWHRVHQLGGILVCIKHNCFLQDSFVSLGRESSTTFHSAEESLKIQPPEFLRDNNSEHKLFLYLGKNAEWLLTQKKLSLEQGELRERYYNLLLKRGYAYYNGRIKGNKLYEAFNQHFSLDTYSSVSSSSLDTLGCQIKSPRYAWYLNLLGTTPAKVINHPIRHLLLMNFLGVTAKDFFDSFVEYKPFGVGPYPCLNKASEHYLELNIRTCEIVDNTVKNKRGIPCGLFFCGCGFIYQRLGCDNSIQDKYKYSSVKEYGKVWEEKLKELWMNLNLSVAQIAEILNTSAHCVTRHAIRLSLPMNQPNTRNVEGYSRYRNPRKTFTQLLSRHRGSWLEHIKKYPNATRSELQRIATQPYFWLRKHDFDWIQDNSPKIKRVYERRLTHDWKKIDENLSIEVKHCCQKILMSTNPFQRVSLSAIIREVGHQAWLERRFLKLPKTHKIINFYYESTEDFVLRKIEQLERRFIEENTIPCKALFMELAGSRSNSSKYSIKVKERMLSALDTIKNSVESNKFINSNKLSKF
jgi:hypothetical protein